jgi:meiotic recombination protein DMC1
LSEIKGLSEAKILKILEAARKVCPTGFGFITGKELDMQREKSIVRISTGSKAVDSLLSGGVETKSITEVFGESKGGKTQLCHTMAVTAQIHARSPGKVAFIDTEGTFRPDRIKKIAARFDVDGDTVLNNIVYARCPTYESQMSILEPLAAMMAEDQFRLVILDSITGCFRTDFSGRGELSERQQRLGLHLAKLRKISEEFNVAVLVTNHVMSDPSGAMFISDPKKPVGGHVIAHASTVRLSVRKGKQDQRVIKVIQAPHLADGEETFVISDGGVLDCTD